MKRRGKWKQFGIAQDRQDQEKRYSIEMITVAFQFLTAAASKQLKSSSSSAW